MDKLGVVGILICGWFLSGLGGYLAIGQEVLPKSEMDSAMTSIKKTVKEKGVVRVIVKVPHTPPGLSPEQKQEIEEHKKEVIAQMEGHGALLIKPLEGQPFIVMELNPEGVERIFELQLVESIQEDTLGSTF
jgi:RNase H-fold protein (predicted Holliday junction resolvase)